MEMIEYETPTHWEDKGMSWNTPDPTNADYAMAIRQALFERCAVANVWPEWTAINISPWKPVSVEAIAGCVETLRWLAPNFVNVDWEDFAEDFSDFPRMWTYKDLVGEPRCSVWERAWHGQLCENGGEWLKRIRNAIDRLTVVRVGEVYGEQSQRLGAEHDPPFEESIGTAMDMAMSRIDSYRTTHRFPVEVTAWSGNTHWVCPDPDYEGSHPEDNVDGYCGYANSESFEILSTWNPLCGSTFDLLTAAVCKSPEGPCGYSNELAQSVFDPGRTGLRQGLNWLSPVRVKDPSDIRQMLGDKETIPKNDIVPVSDFDGEGMATWRRSTKRGWAAKYWCFADYGIEGGFRFRSKEE